LLAGRLISLADQAAGTDNTNTLRIGYIKVGTPGFAAISPIGITQHDCLAGEAMLVCIRGFTSAITLNGGTPKRGSLIIPGDNVDYGKLRINMTPGATQARVGYPAQSNAVAANAAFLVYYGGFYQT
jgi:hypothetical protein